MHKGNLVTSDKHKYDLVDVIHIFAKSNPYLAENFTNQALVTPSHIPLGTKTPYNPGSRQLMGTKGIV